MSFCARKTRRNWGKETRKYAYRYRNRARLERREREWKLRVTGGRSENDTLVSIWAISARLETETPQRPTTVVLLSRGRKPTKRQEQKRWDRVCGVRELSPALCRCFPSRSLAHTPILVILFLGFPSLSSRLRSRVRSYNSQRRISLCPCVTARHA